MPTVAIKYASTVSKPTETPPNAHSVSPRPTPGPEPHSYLPPETYPAKPNKEAQRLKTAIRKLSAKHRPSMALPIAKTIINQALDGQRRKTKSTHSQ